MSSRIGDKRSFAGITRLDHAILQSILEWSEARPVCSADVAEAVGTSAGAVRVTLHRLRRRGIIEPHDASAARSPQLVVELTERGRWAYDNHLAAVEADDQETNDDRA